MLSRSAQGLYWMGRNLERAEHLCRLLRNQVESLVDRPVREIHFGWSRIYGSLHRQPPVGNLEPEGGEDFTLADSYTLADDLTFERSNPDSVWSCFALGRENARQMRHCISADMWTSLNGAYLRLQGQRIEDIWRTSPEDFYMQTCRDIHAFGGVAEATMYRGEGWRFIRLGRFIERAQLATSLFLGPHRGRRSTGRVARLRLDKPVADIPGFRSVQAGVQRRDPTGSRIEPGGHGPAFAEFTLSVARRGGARTRRHWAGARHTGQRRRAETCGTRVRTCSIRLARCRRPRIVAAQSE